MVARSIGPALAQALGELSDTTRVLRLPSPARLCQAKWKASAVPKMSAPPPWMVQVPPLRLCDPAGEAVPMSPQVQPAGQTKAGGGTSPGVTATESKVTVPPTPWAWEVRANPARRVPGTARTTVDPGTAVQVVPSGEVYAV